MTTSNEDGRAIDLTELDSYDRAWVMINRPDCPIDLTGLSPYNRARVMANRSDCPIDLTGLDSYDRARVMAKRPDCPIDLTGLSPADKERVMANRPLCPPDKLIAEYVERQGRKLPHTKWKSPCRLEIFASGVRISHEDGKTIIEWGES